MSGLHFCAPAGWQHPSRRPGRTPSPPRSAASTSTSRLPWRRGTCRGWRSRWFATGRTVHERGYGVRSVATGEPVDQHTLFAVGSTSKAFTSTALGMLVDEGRLGWDDRVIDHIPWFEMHDAYATRRAHRPRPAHPPQRSRPGRRGVVHVAARPRRDHPPGAPSAAHPQLPRRVAIPEPHVPDRRRGCARGQRPHMGRLCAAAHLRAARNVAKRDIDRAAGPNAQRGDAARAGRRSADPGRAQEHRQCGPRRLDLFQRLANGALGGAAPCGRRARRRAAGERQRDGRDAPSPDADPGRRAREQPALARRGHELQRVRAGLVGARLSRPQGGRPRRRDRRHARARGVHARRGHRHGGALERAAQQPGRGAHVPRLRPTTWTGARGPIRATGAL